MDGINGRKYEKCEETVDRVNGKEKVIMKNSIACRRDLLVTLRFSS